MSRSRQASDKSMQHWHGSTADGTMISARIGNDFSDGHSGMARAVRGAKKYVRSRIRFHNKMALKKSEHDD